MSLGRPATVLFKGEEEDGAGYKIRTRDPLITNQVLYQLS